MLIVPALRRAAPAALQQSILPQPCLQACLYHIYVFSLSLLLPLLACTIYAPNQVPGLAGLNGGGFGSHPVRHQLRVVPSRGPEPIVLPVWLVQLVV